MDDAGETTTGALRAVKIRLNESDYEFILMVAESQDIPVSVTATVTKWVADRVRRERWLRENPGIMTGRDPLRGERRKGPYGVKRGDVS